MLDGYGRHINYLRLSVTDRCNLRCLYCVPAERPDPIPEAELLSASELEQVARAAIEVGFAKVRLTGGEPLTRRDVVEVVTRLAGLPGMRELVMTTNGLRLAELARPLFEAGLRRVNIHLDSLDRARAQRLMQLGAPDKVWAGILAAEQAGLTPIKLNMVVVRGHNEPDVVEMARLTREREWHVRFIELMPIGAAAGFALEHYVSSQEVMAHIEATLGRLLPLNGGALVGEARLYRLQDGRGTLGFISPVSNPYCASCDHMRVTADGQLRLCLLADQEIDLRQALRSGASHQELVRLFQQAIAAKPRGNHLQHGQLATKRAMIHIGG